MIPARTALAQTAANPAPHLGFIYFPHGAIMSQWTPASTGAGFAILSHPETAGRRSMEAPDVVSNLEKRGARAGACPGAGHLAELRAAPRNPGPLGWPTIDQIAAAHIGQDTPLPSLEVGVEGRGGGGTCDRDFGCSYSGTISFRTPNTPLPMETEPRKLFQRLFGQGDYGGGAPATGQAVFPACWTWSPGRRGPARTLGPPDRAMLSDYLETRPRDRAPHSEDGSARPLPCRHSRGSRRRHSPHRSAHQSDVRSGRSRLSGQHDPHLHFHDGGRGKRPDLHQIGVPDAFHPLSHHNNEQAKLDKLVKIQNYHTSVFAKFLTSSTKCRMAMAPCWIIPCSSMAAT